MTSDYSDGVREGMEQATSLTSNCYDSYEEGRIAGLREADTGIGCGENLIIVYEGREVARLSGGVWILADSKPETEREAWSVFRKWWEKRKVREE